MISNRGHFQLKNALSRDNRGICRKSIHTGEFLLGDDWQKELQEAKESARSVREGFQLTGCYSHRHGSFFLDVKHHS